MAEPAAVADGHDGQRRRAPRPGTPACCSSGCRGAATFSDVARPRRERCLRPRLDVAGQEQAHAAVAQRRAPPSRRCASATAAGRRRGRARPPPRRPSPRARRGRRIVRATPARVERGLEALVAAVAPRRGPSHTSPTSKARSRNGTPPAWSGWAWVTTMPSMRRTPSHQRYGATTASPTSNASVEGAAGIHEPDAAARRADHEAVALADVEHGQVQAAVRRRRPPGGDQRDQPGRGQAAAAFIHRPAAHVHEARRANTTWPRAAASAAARRAPAASRTGSRRAQQRVRAIQATSPARRAAGQRRRARGGDRARRAARPPRAEPPPGSGAAPPARGDGSGRRAGAPGRSCAAKDAASASSSREGQRGRGRRSAGVRSEDPERGRERELEGDVAHRRRALHQDERRRPARAGWPVGVEVQHAPGHEHRPHPGRARDRHVPADQLRRRTRARRTRPALAPARGTRSAAAASAASRAATSATCAPEMASTWYVPAARNVSAVSRSTPVRSPSTMARTRPCSGPGSTACRRRRRASARTRVASVRRLPVGR